MGWIDDLQQFLGTGSYNSSFTPFSGNTSGVDTSALPSWIDPSSIIGYTGGGASPFAPAPTGWQGALSSLSSGAGTAGSWLPLLTSLLGTGYGAYQFQS